MTTAQDVIDWLAAYKRDFNGLCQALAWQVSNRFGHAPTAYGSARLAYNASRIVSKDPKAAPAGAFHYWSQPSDDFHVAPGLGGERVVMATSHQIGQQVGDAWQHIRVTTVSEYGTVNYLGWSETNGANDFDITAPVVVPAGAPGRSYTTTELDGKPGDVFWGMLDRRRAERGLGDRDRAIRILVGEELNLNGYAYNDASVGGSRGYFYWVAVQKHGNRYFRDFLRSIGFPDGLKEDGVTGPGSQRIEYIICAWVLNHR